MRPFAQSVTLAVSLAVHAAVAGLAGGHARGERARGDAADVIAVDLVSEERTPEPAPELPSSAAPARPGSLAARAPRHTHPYPTADDHDAKDHDRSLVHAPLPVAESVVAPDVELAAKEDHDAPSEAPPLRFVMAVRSQRGGGSVPAEEGAGASAAAADEPPMLENQVTERAHVVQAMAPVYPSSAREGNVEGDVDLEIVVDAKGAVTGARVVGAASHGFDEAAMAAVRAYRFAPAKRRGRAVSVKMKWTVVFRLR